MLRFVLLLERGREYSYEHDQALLYWFEFGLVAASIVFSSCIFGVCPCDTPSPAGQQGEPAKPQFDSEHYLTGDWFGFRNTLFDHGISITGSYTTEPAGNPIGGVKNGATYLHNFGLEIGFDMDKLLCIPGAKFLVTASQRSGEGLTQEDIGNAISVQQIFGGGQTYRLIQMRWTNSCWMTRWSFPSGA